MLPLYQLSTPLTNILSSCRCHSLINQFRSVQSNVQLSLQVQVLQSHCFTWTEIMVASSHRSRVVTYCKTHQIQFFIVLNLHFWIHHKGLYLRFALHLILKCEPRIIHICHSVNKLSIMSPTRMLAFAVLLELITRTTVCKIGSI